MGLFNTVKSFVRLELVSADLAGVLYTINEMQIPIYDLQTIDDLTARFTIPYPYLNHLKAFTDRKGEQIAVLSHKGTYGAVRRLRHREILLFGIAALFALTMFLPSRVLFLEVEGNCAIPSNLILESAKSAGIRFFASKRAVRSEKMKNELLGSLPQLQWAGINTYGCRAVISVKERNVEENAAETTAISRIVAVCDGVVTSCTVTGGSGMCAAGQAVQKNQVLISGYTDCGGVIMAGRASGEIYAQTRHEICSVTPSKNKIRAHSGAIRTRYGLRIGKKRINFYKGSGISDSTCVKMVTEYDLALPGGYVLPLALVREQFLSYELQDNTLEETVLADSLSAFSKATLSRSTVALSIISGNEVLEPGAGIVTMRAVYDCTEMIGREQREQIGDFYGKTD